MRSFARLTVTEPYSRATPVFINKFDAGCFQSMTNSQIIRPGHGGFCIGKFSTANCGYTDIGGSR
jgi:hypothetical protein